jgi:hypothetical protein
MAKLPENRYQTAGELVEDLVIAAQTTGSAVAEEAVVSSSGAVITEKEADDIDEQTLVRPRSDVIQKPPPIQIPLPPTARFNPWKIVIPSLAALVIVFGVIYAFTRGKGSDSPNTAVEPALVADPNSQPVQPSGSPTGRDEAGIPVGAVAATPAVNANAEANASPTPDESVIDNVNVNNNSQPAQNENANANANTNRPAPAVPSPSREVNANAPPPPAPGSKPRQNPTLPPPNVSPTVP